MTLRYVYGIVPATALGALESARIEGLEGALVRAIVDGELAAAASDVSERDYGSAGLNEHVRDLDWLTPRASVHQRVNARLLEIADSVLPLSFGALYRDDERVREMLRTDGADRADRLRALAGRAEWVVTVTRDVDTVPGADDDLRALDVEIAGATPGRAYLLEKRRTSVVRIAGDRADGGVASRVADELGAAAERAYREPVADAGRDVIVVRLSLLGRRDDDGIDERIERLRAELEPEGYRVRATGPWPAYRFGSLG